MDGPVTNRTRGGGLRPFLTDAVMMRSRPELCYVSFLQTSFCNMSATGETAGDFYLSLVLPLCKSTDPSCDLQAGDTLLIMHAVLLLDVLEQHLTLRQMCSVEIARS